MRQPFDTSHDSEAMTEILRYSVIVVVVVVVVFVGIVFFVVIIVTVVFVVVVTSTESEGYDAPIATLHKSRFNINDRDSQTHALTHSLTLLQFSSTADS